MVEFLIQSGANLLAQAHNGKTALQLAQEENQHECATILIAATSKVHIESFLVFVLLVYSKGEILCCIFLTKEKGQSFAICTYNFFVIEI